MSKINIKRILFCVFIIILYGLISNAEGQIHQFKGGLVRGDTAKKQLSIVFTGHEFADGAADVVEALAKAGVKASFFFTGDFYRSYSNIVERLRYDGHYLGAHSDKHLLYCSWKNRDSLLVTYRAFKKDIRNNYKEMKKLRILKNDARYFMPPYEWYNEKIVRWTAKEDLRLINFSFGTLSHADYTTPDMKNYRSSQEIFDNILSYEKKKGLNGFILLLHIGTDPKRTDKLYKRLPDLISYLIKQGYVFMRIDELLKE